MPQPGPAQAAFGHIERGWTRAMFAYDMAQSIDLDRAEAAVQKAAVGAGRDGFQTSRKGPRHFQFQPARLRLSEPAPAIEIAGFHTEPRIDAIVYDFGAVSIAYTIPVHGPFERLLALGEALYENDALLSDSRRRVERLAALLSPAAGRPALSTLVEDYVVHWLEPPPENAAPLVELIDSARNDIARLLRCERAALSRQEVDDALARRIAYGLHDAAIIDWNAALIIGPEADAEHAILEYANVELLEMRLLDDQLDSALERAYAAVQRKRRAGGLLRADHDLRAVARMQMDAAVLFEGVNNALKLVGDQYLARLYRSASERLHLPSWDASILRKLETLESIYQKMSDANAATRMEILEWIIIVLIAVSTVIPFLIAK